MSTSGRVSTILVAALAAAGGALTAAPPGYATPHHPPPHHAALAGSSTSLAGHHWRHRAQIDGKPGRDRVVIVGGRDLTLDDFGMGFGHVTVTVHPAHHGRVATIRRFLVYMSVRKPWTPWLGATDLDRRGGKEIVIGFSSGAHTQGFTALTYRRGDLRRLKPPGGSTTWSINSSAGTGSQGWRCTSDGVQQRAVFPDAVPATEYRVLLDSYVRRGNRWVRTDHQDETVPADTQGNPPASTNNYPRFLCRGLPRNVL